MKLFKLAFVATLCSVATLQSSNQAQAQFVPNFRPGIYAFNPLTGQSVGYNLSFGYNLNLVARNPFTGQVSAVELGQYYSGPFMPWLARPAYLPYAQSLYANNYYGGAVAGSGAMDPSQNPIVQEQLRILKAAGVRPNDNDVQVRKMIADRMEREQQNRVAERPELDLPFLKATEQMIASGEVFQELSDAILKLEKQGVKAKSPLLTPDLLGTIRYVPSIATEILEVLQVGRPEFPEFLEQRGWLVIRSELQSAIYPVVDAAYAGKKIDQTDLNRLVRKLRAIRAEVIPLSKSLEFSEATQINKLLNRFEHLSKLTNQPELQQVFKPDWLVIGATVSEFVNRNDRFQLMIDAADEGGFDAYFSLYRAMLEYYVALVEKSKAR